MKGFLNKFGLEGLHDLSEFLQSAWHVALILLLAWLVVRLAHRLIRAFRIYMSTRAASPEEVKRVETLGRVFRYVASVVVSVVAGMLVLNELGISIAPILAAAGVVGVAVGFGAQSLIRDYFNGFFLLIENQVRQGDVVEAGGKAGLVEEVTLRYVKLRDYDGNVHFVPNGVIGTVTNRSRGFAFSVIDVGVAYREDLDEVFALMREAGAEMRRDPEFASRIIEDLEIAGVENWADSAVIVRCRYKVMPLEQWGVRREYLRRLKNTFDRHGIEIPYPHLTLYPGTNKDGSVPILGIGPAGDSVTQRNFTKPGPTNGGQTA
ncbi:MAG: mechanosensitive ion channel family protein [Betaproteobacteria bacterium]|nr:mechanosensitive ion channel family protein [Betaproteobacteria bacterium]